MSLTFGILTISDTCSQNRENDKSGPVLEDLVSKENSEIGKLWEGTIMCKDIVPDDEDLIRSKLIIWSDNVRLNVILTTGGTGFSYRDVTPEATKKVIDKEAPGLAHAMMAESLKITPMAMLSRAVCGIRKKTLIINLPGSPKAAKENFCAIARVIPHAVDLTLGAEKSVKATHQLVQQDDRHHACPHKSHASVLKLDDVAGRLRESPFPMISLEEAQGILMKTTKDQGAHNESVGIWDSLGRVVAMPIYAQCDLPPFRASIKDGYAVIASDGKGARRVLGGVEAGQEPGSMKIEPGTCVRINTGAAVPDEATAVVQVEDTKLLETTPDGKDEKIIEILTVPTEGQDIRPVGSDIRKGRMILERDTIISATVAGSLAACGIDRVVVTRVPRIGVLSTGNELQEPGESARPGHIYDSNRITLLMMLRERGYQPIDLGVATDRESDMIAAIREAMNRADFIVTTGSVSMGDRDMLKPVLKDVFRAEIHFGRVNLKPGKPTTYATCYHDGYKKYFLCLPGNPASAVVTAKLFVFPLLNLLTWRKEEPIILKVELTSNYNLDPRPEFARADLACSSKWEHPKAYTTGNQISSNLRSCVNANALLMLPARTAERTELKEGDLVQAMLLDFNTHVISGPCVCCV